MSSDQEPFCQVFFFKATDECVADPSLFKTVRDEFYGLWGEDLEGGGYWGQTVERPNRYYWILLWKSREHYERAQKSEKLSPIFAKLDYLIEERTALLFLDFKHPVRPILESPVTEVIFVRLPKDVDYDEMDRRSQNIIDMQHARGTKGYHESTWRFTPENDGGIYMAGWDSIENHMLLGTEDEEFVARSEEAISLTDTLFILHVKFQH